MSHLRLSKIKKLTPPRYRIKKKNRVGRFEENPWIKRHGGVVIADAYEGDGGIWLVAARSNYALPHDPYYGLVCLDEKAWGIVDKERLEEMKNEGDVEERFKDLLPCTLRELFEGTLVWTYFSSV
jgi:hypothetical protein